jgi:hypothetical protein
MRAAALCILSMVILGEGYGCGRTSGDSPPPAQGPASQEASTSNEKAAQSAAEEWLSLVDAANYSQSWAEAAAGFKNRVDQSGWEKAVNGVRTPIGKVQSRTLKVAEFATSLPGAPDGEYVVLKFETTFEKKQHAVETVTPTKEADGRWRVGGYFIK